MNNALKNILVAVSVVGAGVAAGALVGVVIERRRTRSMHAAAAGSMNVGAVDEVELGAGIGSSMRGETNAEIYDPEEIPSEHPEINELRNKMPFG